MRGLGDLASWIGLRGVSAPPPSKPAGRLSRRPTSPSHGLRAQGEFESQRRDSTLPTILPICYGLVPRRGCLGSLPKNVRCPACAATLEAVAEEYECSACRARYPVHAGIPWLFRDVASSRSQWSAKQRRFETCAENDLSAWQEALRRSDLLGTTRCRLERAIEGTRARVHEVRGLLDPFVLAGEAPRAELPKDRIPSPQHFGSYFDTIFRDWAWGEEEVVATTELVRSQLPESLNAARVLVIGGGAGRLACEMTRFSGVSEVVQLDINPLLTRIGAELSRGADVTLTELPLFPRGVDHVAVPHRLQPPLELPSPPCFLLGDAFSPPFEVQSFDVLVTPWFIDIVPEDFRSLSRRFNQLLVPGGSWLSFGPLSFESQPVAQRYTPEEIAESLEAAGMRVDSQALVRVAYQHSPHGMPKRSEDILSFQATKIASADTPEDFHFYPPWMLDASRPVPAFGDWQRMHHEKVFDVQILALIDGRASIQDIVKRLSHDFGIPVDQCGAVVNRFFQRFIESDTL